MNTVKIYFSNLVPEKQQELLDAYGIDDPADMNWDLDIVPICVIEIEESIEDENS